LVAVFAATALLNVSAGVSGAGTVSVLQAIKTQDRVVRGNPEYKSLKHFKLNSAAQAKVEIPKLRSLKLSLERAATDVSHASVTSAQAAGRSDWVRGVRLLAAGVGGLATGLNDLDEGRYAAAKSAVLKADRRVLSAETIGETGDQLLGLPSSD